MKRLALLLIVVLFLSSCGNKQSNVDRHFGSDTSNIQLRDYQLEVYNDSTVIWDGDRRVSTLKYNNTQALDSVINQDNQ